MRDARSVSVRGASGAGYSIDHRTERLRRADLLEQRGRARDGGGRAR